MSTKSFSTGFISCFSRENPHLFWLDGYCTYDVVHYVHSFWTYVVLNYSSSKTRLSTYDRWRCDWYSSHIHIECFSLFSLVSNTPNTLGGVLIVKVISAALLICNDVRQLLVQPDTRFIVCGLRSFEICYCLRAISNLLRSHESCLF